MSKIVLEGFYGYGNLGDEAILQVFLEQFQKRGCELSVMTGSPEQVRKDYGINAIPKSGKKSLLKRLSAILSSDLYILGGGGLLKDFGNDSSSLKRWLHKIDLANKLGKKTALGAIGVENIRFEESFNELNRVISKVNLITVRDQISHDLLRKAGIENEIHIFTDPAVLLGNAKLRTLKSGKVRVFVSLRHWFSTGFESESIEKENHFHRELAQFLDSIAEDSVLTFIPMRTSDYDNDIDIAKKIVSMMKIECEIEIIENTPSVAEFLEMLENCDIMLAMRLHAAILATSMGIPTIAFSYSPKLDGYMDNISMNKFCLAPGAIQTDSLHKIFNEFLSNHAFFNKVLLDNNRTQKSLAMGNIEMLNNTATG